MFPSAGDPGRCESASCKVKLIHIYGSGKVLHLAISGKERHKWVRVVGEVGGWVGRGAGEELGASEPEMAAGG